MIEEKILLGKKAADDFAAICSRLDNVAKYITIIEREYHGVKSTHPNYMFIVPSASVTVFNATAQLPVILDVIFRKERPGVVDSIIQEYQGVVEEKISMPHQSITYKK